MVDEKVGAMIIDLGAALKRSLEEHPAGHKKRWWVSWYQPVGSDLELRSPWWCSGSRADGAQTICAAVEATNASEAMAIVRSAQNDDITIEWRFVEERPDDWEPFCDRFQRADWMEWPGKAAR